MGGPMRSRNGRAMSAMLTFKASLRVVLISLLFGMTACTAIGGTEEGDGVGLTGIDHLADHLSVQNFWVNGYNGAQAGDGGSLVCCVVVPHRWRSGLKAHVEWSVTNWKERTSQAYKADVPIDQYDEVGRMFVHFLGNGQVRITLSNEAPWGATYSGTREPIPKKYPWDVYPWPRNKNGELMFGGPNDKHQ